MIIYIFLQVILGIVAGLMFAVRTKKAEGVVYGKSDKAGVITNILLVPAYIVVAPFCMFVGVLSYPAYEGFLGVIGGILCLIASSSTLFCGLGIGFSVSLRKKGKSKLSFAVQFAGFVGIGLMLLIFFTCYGTLLDTLN